MRDPPKRAASAKADRRNGTKASPARGQRRAAGAAASQVAQVRLQADEMAALREVMRQLSLPTTSEALREGIRLLLREAGEATAAHEIERFYANRRAPLPEGVAPATQEELAAADAEQW
jgi:hypothetical protein